MDGDRYSTRLARIQIFEGSSCGDGTIVEVAADG
jgi:hypothetical protein